MRTASVAARAELKHPYDAHVLEAPNLPQHRPPKCDPCSSLSEQATSNSTWKCRSLGGIGRTLLSVALFGTWRIRKSRPRQPTSAPEGTLVPNDRCFCDRRVVKRAVKTGMIKTRPLLTSPRGHSLATILMTSFSRKRDTPNSDLSTRLAHACICPFMYMCTYLCMCIWNSAQILSNRTKCGRS